MHPAAWLQEELVHQSGCSVKTHTHIFHASLNTNGCGKVAITIM